MQVGILVTDGGPHSAQKWALATAGQLIQIAPGATGDKAVEARKLETKFIEILEDTHTAVSDHEISKIHEHGLDRLGHDFADAGMWVEDTLAKVIAAAKDTPFFAHFNEPFVQNHIKETLGSHFATHMDVHRSWFADKNPTHQAAQDFKAKRV